MSPSTTQRRALRYYHLLHGTRPTMLSMLAWWRYLLAVILVMVAVLILPTTLNFLVAGFFLGMVVRDIQRFWHWARPWPMYEAILAGVENEALLADDR